MGCVFDVRLCYQKTIIVSTASRLMPTARSPMMMASSISMRLIQGAILDVKGCELLIRILQLRNR